jgi:hypothetical protein
MQRNLKLIGHIVICGIALVYATTTLAVNRGCDLKKACDHMEYCAFKKQNWTNGGGPGALIRAMEGGDGNQAATLTGICQGLNGTKDSWIADGSCTGDQFATMTHVALSHDCGPRYDPQNTGTQPDGISAVQWCAANNNSPADAMAKLATMPNGKIRENASAAALIKLARQKAKEGRDNEAIQWAELCQWHNEAEQNAIERDRDAVLRYLRQ